MINKKQASRLSGRDTTRKNILFDLPILKQSRSDHEQPIKTKETLIANKNEKKNY